MFALHDQPSRYSGPEHACGKFGLSNRKPTKNLNLKNSLNKKKAPVDFVRTRMLYWFQWLLFPIIVVFCPIKNTIQSLRPCQRDSKAKSNCCISIVATYGIGLNGSFNYSTCCFQGNFFQLQGWSHKLTKRCKHYFNTERKCLSRFGEANLTYNILYEIVSFGHLWPAFSMSPCETTALGFGLLWFLFSFFLGFFRFDHL